MCVYYAYFINWTLQLSDVHKSRNLLILLSGPLQMTLFFLIRIQWTHNIQINTTSASQGTAYLLMWQFKI